MGCGTSPGSNNDSASKKATPAATADAKPDIAKLGPVTLTVWDQEVRGGQNKQMKQLIEQFQQKYPNVTIDRVAKSFDDLQKTIKLAVSGSKAPDVVEANQGRPIMGAARQGRAAAPADDYAKVYGWNDRYSPLLLDLNKFCTDGKDFGSGDLYGLSQMGEIVGVFYNKEKVADAAHDARRVRAAAAGGQVEGRHSDPVRQPRQVARDPRLRERARPDRRQAGGARLRVRRKEGANFNQPSFTDAATKITDWVKKGYFTPDFNGTGYDPAWQSSARARARS